MQLERNAIIHQCIEYSHAMLRKTPIYDFPELLNPARVGFRGMGGGMSPPPHGGVQLKEICKICTYFLLCAIFCK